jgi:hypothetical protein
MYDYAEVTKIPINVSVQSAEVRSLVLQRMNVMQRELQHAQKAFTALRHALTAPVPSSRPLADALMNSRNWLVSVVASYTYMQAMMETVMPPSIGAGVEKNFRNAAGTGVAIARQWRLGVKRDIWKDMLDHKKP